MTVVLTVSSTELYPVYELINKYDGITLNEQEVMKPTSMHKFVEPKIKFPDKDNEDLFIEDFKACFNQSQLRRV